ncbi:hypothetical protein LY76DRAFT_91289 [Colletotrichum caudatum]|nr:hypothetical protein LY76DRAFT_91289 [Colletotrichum caudatum]
MVVGGERAWVASAQASAVRHQLALQLAGSGFRRCRAAGREVVGGTAGSGPKEGRSRCNFRVEKEDNRQVCIQMI